MKYQINEGDFMLNQEILNNLTQFARNPYLFVTLKMNNTHDNTDTTLQLLAQNKQMTAGEISVALDIKPSSVTQIIKKLAAKDLISKVKSDQDSRVTLITLTDAGKAALKQQDNTSEELQNLIFKGLSDEDKQRLNEYLIQINDNLTSEAAQTKMEELCGRDERFKHFGKMGHFGRMPHGFKRFGRRFHHQFQPWSQNFDNVHFFKNHK